MLETALRWLPSGGDMTLVTSMWMFAVFFAACFVLVPRTFLCPGAGAGFGLPAILVILPATTLGGALAFLLARYFLAERVQRYVGSRPRLRRIAVAVDEEGWRLIALLRLASPLPNAIQNYVFGLTRIGLVPFAVTSFVFTIPQVVLYVYLGSAGRSVMFDESMSPMNRAILLVGLVSIAVTAALVIRRVRRDRLDLRRRPV